MKNVLLILLVISTITACKKKEPEPTTEPEPVTTTTASSCHPEPLLEGDWVSDSSQYKYYNVVLVVDTSSVHSATEYEAHHFYCPYGVPMWNMTWLIGGSSGESDTAFYDYDNDSIYYDDDYPLGSGPSPAIPYCRVHSVTSTNLHISYFGAIFGTDTLIIHTFLSK